MVLTNYIKRLFRNSPVEKIIFLLIALSLTGPYTLGCAPRYGKYQPETKETLRTLACGAIGAIASWNTGGAIVGAFVADIYNVSYVKYEDKKLEDIDEASRKRHDSIEEAEKKSPGDRKAEKESPGDRKAEKESPGDRKAEKESPGDRKAEKEMPGDRKAEKESPGDRKAEKEMPGDRKAEKEMPGDRKAEKGMPVDRKAEKEMPVDRKAEKEMPVERVKFSIEDFRVSAQTVRSGSPMEAKVQYTIQTPKDEQVIKLTETRIFFAVDKTIELDKRDIYRTEGRYVSIIKFHLPEELPKGYCILYTTLSDGKRSKTERTVINII